MANKFCSNKPCGKKEIHISAGGPSHTYIHKFHPNICVNRDILRYLDAEYFVTCDISFSRNYRREISEFSGERIFVNNASGGKVDMDMLEIYDVFINTETHHGFSKKFRGFSSGYNSGFTAVQWALLLGYTEIHLHGIDCVQTELDGKPHPHWHGGYGHSAKHVDERNEIYFQEFRKAIEATTGVEFVSHSKISRLNEVKNVSACVS